MRLIDANAIPYRDYLRDEEPRVYKSQVDNLPTIDPVKHGRWAKDKETRNIPYLLSRLEKAEAALSAMRVAYVNKDPDTPHAFEVDAMNAAAGILGEWTPKGE